MAANGTQGQPTKAGDESDVSMEDILQSIRRIIAEDGDETGAPAEAGGSDVLELTEMLADDGSVISLKDKAPEEAPKPVDDVLNRIDSMLSVEKPVEAEAPAAPAPEPEPVVVAAPAVEQPKAPEPAPAPAPAPVQAAPKEEAPMRNTISDDNSILSLETTQAVTSTLTKLDDALEPPPIKLQSPVFASGNSVENMVMDMLRPMMKDWLDSNLPTIVERIVEREVRKLIR